ncbi:MAG: glycosyltransferase [Myxococcota bacterium]
MSEPAQVFIAVFAYSGVTPATLDCLLRDLPRLPGVTYHRESHDALISRSRSVAATEFLRSQSEILIMLDHDLSWQPGDLERLIERVGETRAVVGGLYAKRGFGHGIALRFAEPGDHELGDDRLVRATYLATGFFGVHRDVLQKLAGSLPLTSEDFWPFFLPVLTEPRHAGERPEYLSEDWAFCQRAAAAGFELWVDLRPRLVHNGAHGFRVLDGQFELPSDDDRITLRSGP